MRWQKRFDRIAEMIAPRMTQERLRGASVRSIRLLHLDHVQERQLGLTGQSWKTKSVMKNISREKTVTGD